MPRRACAGRVSAAPARSTRRAGSRPASCRRRSARSAAPNCPRCASGQQLQLMGARRPAAFGEPAQEGRRAGGGADRARGDLLVRHAARPSRAASQSPSTCLDKGSRGAKLRAAMFRERCAAPRSTYLAGMRPEALLCPTPEGLYCPPGDFYIDPVRPVERALITHGHADHARSGHGAVLATPRDAGHHGAALRRRFRRQRRRRPRLARRIDVNGVERHASTRPAMCSARRRCGRARTACASSSPATTSAARDPTCAPFEPVPCDVFITEATFGLPVFRHPRRPRRDRQAARHPSRSSPSARIWSAPMRSARRSA